MEAKQDKPEKPTKTPLIDVGMCRCIEVARDLSFFGTEMTFKCRVHGWVTMDRRPLLTPNTPTWQTWQTKPNTDPLITSKPYYPAPYYPAPPYSALPYSAPSQEVGFAWNGPTEASNTGASNPVSKDSNTVYENTVGYDSSYKSSDSEPPKAEG